MTSGEPRHIDQHQAMCLAAVASGARGIYIEKPFCRTSREADEIVAACAAMLYQDGRPCTREDISQGDEGVGLVAGNRIHGRFEMGDGTPLFFDSIRHAGDSAASFGWQMPLETRENPLALMER